MSTTEKTSTTAPAPFQVALRGVGEWSGGILDAIGPLTGRNRVAANFYDGSGWVKFRPWEKLFLMLQGGRHRARRQILRHLTPGCTLEVGIGDGENIPLLPEHNLYGIDIARTQLDKCASRFGSMHQKLVWGEAESLPFADD